MKFLKYFFAVILTVNIIFSCQKEEFTEIEEAIVDGTIQNRSDSTTLDSNFIEFVSAFNNQKDSINPDSISELNPLFYEIDLSSISFTNSFNGPAVIANVNENSDEISDWMKNQVLIKKMPEGNFQFSSLIYLADSTFYTDNGIKPLLPNFTGGVVQYASTENSTNFYTFYLGDIIDEVQANIKGPDECFSSFGTSRWKKIKGWIKSAGSSIGGFFSGFGSFFSGLGSWLNNTGPGTNSSNNFGTNWLWNKKPCLRWWKLRRRRNLFARHTSLREPKCLLARI